MQLPKQIRARHGYKVALPFFANDVNVSAPDCPVDGTLADRPPIRSYVAPMPHEVAPRSPASAGTERRGE